MKITLGSLLATILTYVVLGVSGLALAIPPGYASPVFPAAGLAVALALCFGSRILPAIWLGSLTVNLAVALLNGKLDSTSIVIAGVVASGAVLQAWSARWLTLHWLGASWRRLETEKDIALFLFTNAPLASLISATIGTFTLYVTGRIPTEEFFYSWWNWWVGDTLGVLIVAPLTLIFLLQADLLWKARRLTVAFPMLVTLSIIVVAFLGASNRQQNQQVEQIEEHGRVIAHSLENRFIAHQEALSALKRLVEVMPDMTFQQFEYFTQITLQDNKDIFALSFNPYVPDSSRSAFERSMAQTNLESFRITERNNQKQLMPALKRPRYVPVGYIAPIEGNQPAIGFDINSESIRRDAIERSIASKCTTVTAPVQLVQEEKNRVGVLVMTPAYRKGGHPTDNGTENLIGFAVGVFKVDQMVQIATQRQVPTGILFRLTDSLADDSRSLLFLSNKEGSRPIDPYVYRTQLTVADRQWNLEVFPNEKYLHQHKSGFAWIIGITGFLFSSLLQILLLSMTGRTSIINNKVYEQTIQLKDARDAAEANQIKSEYQSCLINSLIDSIPDIIFFKDLNGAYLGCNPSFAEFVGRPRDEIIGATDYDLFNQDVADFFRENDQRMLESRKSRHNEEWITYPDGRRAMVDTVKTPYWGPNGALIGLLGISRDITERKQYELALEQNRDTADAASKAKSEFLANMSHEIRTPMNGIMGMTQLLESTELTDNQQKYLDIIRASVDGLMSLINDLLDLAKIESGKVELEQANFSLRASINDIIKIQIARIQGKGLSIKTDILSEVPDNLIGDQLRLKQILLNFLSNAIKFTHEGGIHIAVTVSERDDRIVQLKFAVTDSGIGISSQSLQKIFKPFVQEDASTTRQYGGTGLGLTICDRLTKLMGGKIWGESTEGTGSTFFIQIPFVLNEAVTEFADRKNGNKQLVPWDGPPLRILHVDDQETNLFFVTEVLQRVGHTVIEARDGQEALQRYEHDVFDVILMDIQMPVMHGTEATRIIREREKNNPRHTVIIALTARALQEEREKILNQGFDGYVAKPIEINELLNEIKICLPGSVLRTCSDNESSMLDKATPLDKEQLSALLSEIEMMLQNHDLEVIDKVAELIQIVPITPAIDTLRGYVKQFDFTSALANIRDLDNEFKIIR